jgi:hypothetical protein
LNFPLFCGRPRKDRGLEIIRSPTILPVNYFEQLAGTQSP